MLFLVYVITENVVASFEHSCIAWKMNVWLGDSNTFIVLQFKIFCHLTFNFSDPELLI